MLSAKQTKYLHISSTNRSGKWKTISLSNLAKELSKREASEILPMVKEVAVNDLTLKINKLRNLKAPAIIMNSLLKELEKLKRNVHPDLGPLKRVLK
jgi:hypothetical protein